MANNITNNKLPPPHLAITLGVLASSTAAILIRFAQNDAPSLVIAAYRLSLASIILLPITLLRNRNDFRQLTWKQWILSIGAGVFLAIHFAAWISSLEFTSVASSVVLVSTSPLFVSAFSPLFLGESIHRGLRYGLILSLIGSLIVGVSDAYSFESGMQSLSIENVLSTQALKGDFLALLGAMAGAAYILIGRRLRGQVALLPYISVAYGSAAIVLVGTAWIMGYEFFGYRIDTYLWFLLLALFPQLIGHSSINWALKFLPAAYVSITLLGEPVASTLWAYLFLGEVPSGLMLIGGILVLIGIVVASQPQPGNRNKIEQEVT